LNEEVIWAKILNSLKNQLTSLSYEVWFEKSKLKKLKDGKAYIIVEMPAGKKHIAANYGDLIISLLYDETQINYDLVLLLEEELDQYNYIFNEKKEIIIEDNNKNNEDKNDIIQQDSSPPIEEVHRSYLNPNLTFDNFVVGNSNKFAHAAALSVAESPGNLYNPLFLYGNSGVGKTHLMQAIGNYIEKNSTKKVLYVTSDQFINDFIKMSRKDENSTNFSYIEFFKNKYRNIDVLIIDDIQSLGTAPKSQDELFHTFNNLYNDSKQIIVSSDTSPDDLKKLEEHLRTRFNWGLKVNISPPDYELRKNIVKNKIKANDVGKDIPDDVIEYIATNIGPDVRHLEGAITRLIAYSTMMSGKDIDLDLAIEALNDYTNKGLEEKNDIRRIQRIVADKFQISVDDIRSKKRSSNISGPRQIAYYLCRTMTSESFPRIGIEFGGKDHTTVMYAVDKIEKEIRENVDLRNTIEDLKKAIERVD